MYPFIMKSNYKGSGVTAIQQEQEQKFQVQWQTFLPGYAIDWEKGPIRGVSIIKVWSEEPHFPWSIDL